MHQDIVGTASSVMKPMYFVKICKKRNVNINKFLFLMVLMFQLVHWAGTGWYGLV